MKFNFEKNLLNLKKKNVIITGSNGLLGQQLIKVFNKLEANPIAVDKNNSNNKNYFKCNLNNKQEVENLFKNLNKKYRTLDILINNAGVSIFTPFHKRTEKEIYLTNDTNINATIFCINQFANYCKINKTSQWKSIVNISSIYSIISPDPRIYKTGDRKNSEIYGASKSAINQLTKYYAVHLANKKIRVNGVLPGGIYNEKYPQSKNFIKEYSFRNPLKRMGTSNEIVNGIVFLSSSMSSYVTGHNLVIDGGMSAW
jgi:NAD(P)-dependent dehydrogenase (short-subunit alcohol dehydrogenase family)